MPPTGLGTTSGEALSLGVLQMSGEPAGEKSLPVRAGSGGLIRPTRAAKIQPLGNEKGGLAERDALHPSDEVEDGAAGATAPEAVVDPLRGRHRELLWVRSSVDGAGASEAPWNPLHAIEHVVVLEHRLEGDLLLQRPEVDPS